MSDQIVIAYAKHYASNVVHLSQQKSSYFGDKVRNEHQNVEQDFYDRIGSVTAQLKAGRQEDVAYSNTPHSRRRVVTKKYFYADTTDKDDKVKTVIDPNSAYVQAAVMALNRAKDDVVIAAALGSSYGGVDGGTPVVLPDSQKVAAHDGSTLTGVNMNVKTLRAVSKKFNANEVDKSIKRYVAMGSSQLEALLGQTEVTSSDYNSIKALVMGDVDTFMGFKFVFSERLPRSSTNITYNKDSGVVGSGTGTITAANSRRCFAWAEDGLLLATAEELFTSIDILPSKHFLSQIYASQNYGATRMEEEKVVEIICSE